ncbi:MAG: hypothetical protein ACIAQU_04415 [Phycisphaerales bacterium JB064]
MQIQNDILSKMALLVRIGWVVASGIVVILLFVIGVAFAAGVWAAETKKDIESIAKSDEKQDAIIERIDASYFRKDHIPLAAREFAREFASEWAKVYKGN